MLTFNVCKFPCVVFAMYLKWHASPKGVERRQANVQTQKQTLFKISHGQHVLVTPFALCKFAWHMLHSSFGHWVVNVYNLAWECVRPGPGAAPAVGPAPKRARQVRACLVGASVKFDDRFCCWAANKHYTIIHYIYPGNASSPRPRPPAPGFPANQTSFDLCILILW